MLWRFSDGTTVELGGKVEGATVLAQRLRADLKEPQQVRIWPPPGGEVDLDLNDPALLDVRLRLELDRLVRLRNLPVTLSRPDGIPSLPPPPWFGQQLDPDAIY